jgi:predicted KAP-like P-loop ATPase
MWLPFLGLVIRGLPALIKIATAGVIDADEIVEDELSKVMETLTGDALENYLKQKNTILAFHDALTNLINLTTLGKPIVIFVDELDRCRPPYAISLLERIKHLFDIEGLVFVLSLDKEQLGHSIGAVYGDRIDSASYLKLLRKINFIGAADF